MHSIIIQYVLINEKISPNAVDVGTTLFMPCYIELSSRQKWFLLFINLVVSQCLKRLFSEEFSKAITNPYVIVKCMNKPSMTLSIVIPTSMKTA